MKKRNRARVASLVLVLVLAAGIFAGCGAKTKSQKSGSEVTDVTFPLKEKVTFTMMIPQTETADFKKEIENNALWQKMEEETNVHIEFQFLGDAAADKLTLLVKSGEYGDFMVGRVLNSSSASKYIASELFQDLTDYINEDIMPNLSAKLEETPGLRTSMVAEDGGIYTIPNHEGNPGSSLEGPIWINKAWLDKLGLEIPETLDEFTNCLRAFKNNDPNGNGLKDEIPYICCTADGGSENLETLMGIFGIATKDGTHDAYVQVIDGKVNFVPTMPAYKDAINYLSMLYQEGLMWQQCFTATTGEKDAKETSETCVVGCFTAQAPAITDYQDDYVCIAPPKAEGYEPCWYMNPNVEAGVKNMFYVMDTCENTAVLMAWLDRFYDFNTSIEATIGSAEAGYCEVDEDGKVSVLELDYETNKKLKKESPNLIDIFGSWVRILTISDYENQIKEWETVEVYNNNYEIYKDYVNTELWLRPYYAFDDAYDADVYFQEIDYQVRTYRASWITGRSDINQEWDGFVKTLDSLGLNEYMEILQNAQDTAVKAKEQYSE